MASKDGPVDCGIVSFRMERDQLTFVRAAAKRMGLSLSEMFRASALSVAASNGDDAPEHSYSRGRPKKREVPTVDFLGDSAAGPKAVGVAFANGLPVAELRRVWSLYAGEMDGPIWSLTFRYDATEHARRDAENHARYFASKATGRVL